MAHQPQVAQRPQVAQQRLQPQQPQQQPQVAQQRLQPQQPQQQPQVAQQLQVTAQPQPNKNPPQTATPATTKKQEVFEHGGIANPARPNRDAQLPIEPKGKGPASPNASGRGDLLDALRLINTSSGQRAGSTKDPPTDRPDRVDDTGKENSGVTVPCRAPTALGALAARDTTTVLDDAPPAQWPKMQMLHFKHFTAGESCEMRGDERRREEMRGEETRSFHRLHNPPLR